jgi:ADP-L-glycero-D-manno-heptose 6-epimerase
MQYTNIDFNNKSVLITGGAGFIGSNLAFYFQEHYPKCKIVVFDKFRNNTTLSNGNLVSFGHFKNLIGFNKVVISGDINDKNLLSKLENNYKFDYIFHQAAISDTTVNEQDLMIQTNVNAFEDLLKLAIKHNANMIYASSASTYGDAKSPQTVDEYENPSNLYGFSKLMMDNIARKYIKIENKKQNRNYKSISIVGLRYFNVYGQREFYKNKTASTVIQFGHQLLKGNAPKLFEGSDNILRDFVYIEDIIQANIKASNPKKSGIFNVGTSNPRSFQDIANILQYELKTSFKIVYIENPFIGQYQFHTQANIATTKKYLNYQPKFSLEDGIKCYIPEIKRLYESEVK